MSRWIRTAFFMQIHTFRPQFHNSGPPKPNNGIFHFFMEVLGPGRCLDGFVSHFSCRYTPSDPNFIIPDPHPSNFVKTPKMENAVANIFRTRFEKTPLAKILRPNLWAKNDRMVILSLSTFRGNVRFDCICSIEIQLFSWETTFSFEAAWDLF